VGNPNTAGSDNIYRAKVSEFLGQHGALHGETGVPFIDVQTVLDRIDMLKIRKAAGHDGIQNENIIYGGPNVAVHLCLLFNAMLYHSFVPKDFQFGIIKPLLKNKHGDQTKLKMYRGITLTPVVSKLFEPVLLFV